MVSGWKVDRHPTGSEASRPRQCLLACGRRSKDRQAVEVLRALEFLRSNGMGAKRQRALHDRYTGERKPGPGSRSDILHTPSSRQIAKTDERWQPSPVGK